MKVKQQIQTTTKEGWAKRCRKLRMHGPHLRLLLLFRLLFCGRQCAFALFCTCLGASTSISVWSCLCPRFHWNELIVVSTYSSYAPACAFPHAIFFIFIYFAININSAKKTTPINVCVCVCLSAFVVKTPKDYNHEHLIVEWL